MTRILGTSQNLGGVNEAAVNKDRELAVRAISEDIALHRVDEGFGFSVYTGRINLTTDTFRPVLYIKNNDTDDLVFTTVLTGASPSTGGANDAVLLEQVGNILVTDDLVANGTDLIAFNRNVGAPRQFAGDIKLKADAIPSGNEIKANGVLSTFTDPAPIPLTTIIPKGSAVAIGVTPPAGNTSQDLTIQLSFHLKEDL